MIVCVCRAVSHRQIHDAVNRGARNLLPIVKELGLGSCCGRCIPEARATLVAAMACADESSTKNLFADQASFA